MLSLLDSPHPTIAAPQDASLVPYQQPEQTAPVIYQESFNVEFIGKRKPKSKQQATWIFVRGNEPHTVTLTWSIQTGKVLIHLDGVEIDFYDCHGYSIIQRKVESRELGLHFELVATSVAPNSAGADFRCYECIINGKAFSSLPFVGERHETRDETNGHLVADGDSYSSYSDGGDNNAEDEATPYYMKNLSSVLDIVYPNGIPASNNNNNNN